MRYDVFGNASERMSSPDDASLDTFSNDKCDPVERYAYQGSRVKLILINSQNCGPGFDVNGSAECAVDASVNAISKSPTLDCGARHRALGSRVRSGFGSSYRGDVAAKIRCRSVTNGSAKQASIIQPHDKRQRLQDTPTKVEQ